jgi:hypothetical protein
MVVRPGHSSRLAWSNARRCGAYRLDTNVIQTGRMSGRTKPRRFVLWFCLGLASLAAAEVGLRLLGLGHPVLMRPHPTIEYLAQPNQSLRRFGHLIEYNEFAMRSAPITRQKTNPAELRVLVIGDSVINCGATLDQRDLATTRSAEFLTRNLGRPVAVLNISAGSWGPQNQLAYLQEFGLFDADLAIIEVSTHDLSDVPQFGPLPTSDTQLQPSAIGEAFTRYAIPALRELLSASDSASPVPTGAATPVLERLVARLNAAHLPTLILYHFTRQELRLDVTAIAEVATVRDIAGRHGANFELLGPAFLAAENAGSSPYRSGDPIHTSKVGQGIVARFIEEFVTKVAIPLRQ